MIRKTLAASLLAFAVPAWGIDGVSAEAGVEGDVTMWRVGAQWNWARRWFTEGTWQLGGYWDLAAGAWHSDQATLYDVGITPVFRFARKDGGSPYVEAAIGFHLISDSHVTEDKVFGSAFQFGDHIGAGVRFGEGNRYDLSLRLQHLSNGGIRKPNPGIDFVQVRLQVHLQ
jgi:hypothetical protein